MIADNEILQDACWALSYISDGDNARVQLVVDAGVTSLLLELLDYPNDEVIIPALRTVGNIVTGMIR